ncbi:MAG: carotenoid biosynthesis protein, partial [Spirochaetia bacterium]|nr:carotenoid biosynthesis protein [Spirochaetia bacterium]
ILIWTALVFFISLAAEILGVNTGFPFGTYAYGKNMAPFIWNTPIAIGGAWLSVILSSVFLTRLLFQHARFVRQNTTAFALGAALLASAFDAVMEFAAVKLGYWSWHGDAVPIQNYLSWFVLSFIFSWPAFRTFAGSDKKISPVWHLYPAQLVYFLISLF